MSNRYLDVHGRRDYSGLSGIFVGIFIIVILFLAVRENSLRVIYINHEIAYVTEVRRVIAYQYMRSIGCSIEDARDVLLLCDPLQRAD